MKAELKDLCKEKLLDAAQAVITGNFITINAYKKLIPSSSTLRN
jgi:hypothetical protein